MKNILLILLFFLQIAFCCQAQDSNDIYIKDSVIYYGVRLVDYGLRRNCQACVEAVKGEEISFSPKQVSEYSFGTTSTYVAKDIVLNSAKKRVFLERKIIGAFSLYHYQDNRNDLFFLQRAGELMKELPKIASDGSTFRTLLAEWTLDKPAVSVSSKRVDYESGSIVAFLNKYQGYKRTPLPRMQVGLSIGADLTRLEPVAQYVNPDFKLFDFRYDPGASIGAFVDIPITHFGLSVHVGGQLTNAAFSYSKNYKLADYDFVANLHTLQVPLHVRYTYLKGPVKPYVEAGVLMAWNYFNSNTIQESVMDGNVVEYQGIRTMQLLDDKYVGPSLGCGLELPLKGRIKLFLECRYEHCTGWVYSDFFELSKLNLTTGIAF